MKKIFAHLLTLIVFITGSYVSKAQNKPVAHAHIHTKAFAAMDAKGKLVPYEFDRRSVGDNDVLIDILYSGICHSDIHTVKGDWGPTPYPCVPGHEIVGKVVQIGKNVRKFKVGDIAGVGCMVNSCGECEYCKAGEEQFCTGKGGQVWTYGSSEGDSYTKGGYASNIIVKESFAIKIPKNAPLEKVAPLLCAGITTYSPLRYNKVKKGDKIAVAGFGGLGHMAVQYAKSLGAEVDVFDITEDKRKAAFEMGATKYVNTTKAQEMEGLNSKYSLIISTIPVSFKVEPYLQMLKTDGTMVLIGVPAHDQIPVVNVMALFGRRKMYHSLIGGIRETQEMIDYSVKNNIYAKVEVIPIQQINEAYQNILDGKVQFRYVIDMKSLK